MQRVRRAVCKPYGGENGDFSPAKIGVYFSVYPIISVKTSRSTTKFFTNFASEIWLPEKGKTPFHRPPVFPLILADTLGGCPVLEKKEVKL